MTQRVDIWGLEAFGEETFKGYTERVAEETQELDEDLILENLYAAMEVVIGTSSDRHRLLASRDVLWYLTALTSRQGLNLKDLT